jgi:hypothetical protein
MPVTNEEIYEKLLDIEKRLFSLEQKIGNVKRPDVFEYEQKIKPIQYEQPQPKINKFTPPITPPQEVKGNLNVKKEEKVEVKKKKKSLLDEKDEEENKSFSLKDALGFV